MKIDRLLAIVNYLLAHGRTSAAALAQRFEVSRRTIQRDMEALDRAGIPVVALHGAAGGYDIMGGYSMERQLLTGKGRQHMVAALEALGTATGSRQVADTLAGVEALRPQQDARQVIVDLSAAREDARVQAWLPMMEDAIEQGHILHIEYIDTYQQVTQREVEPVALVYQWYAWYLDAYCRMRGDFRFFKLARIRECEVCEERIDIARHGERGDREQAHGDAGPCLEILLRCRLDVLDAVQEYLTGTVQERQEDCFLYAMRVPEAERMWFSLLMGFGDAVEVLEPPALRARMQAMAEAVAALYRQ